MFFFPAGADTPLPSEEKFFGASASGYGNRGVGQQLFDVKLGRKSLQLGVSQMSLTLFKSDNSPLRTILYQKIASVESDGARLTVRTDDGAVENLSSKHAAALSAAIQAHLDVGTPK